MDYVLFGMGYGATLMLIGWALRTFGPSLKYSDADLSSDVDAQVKRRFWVRFIQGMGGVIAIAGTAFVFITFVVMLVNPDDETGALMSYVVWGFLVVALLAWSWLYVSRFGLTGVWCKEEGYGLRQSSSAASPYRKGTRRSTPIVAPIEPSSAVAPAIDDDAEAEEAATNAPLQGPPAPEYDFGDASATTTSFANRTAALRRLRDKQREKEGNTEVGAAGESASPEALERDPSLQDAAEQPAADVTESPEKAEDTGSSSAG